MLDTLTKLLPQVEIPPEVGIEPAPAQARRMVFWDHFVLWLDLGVGLLVLLAGALLVLPAEQQGLGMAPGLALLAVVVGSVIGVLLLGLISIPGARLGVPTMVLLRPVLGIRGSYLPSFFNFLQLVGWTAFELWAISWAANHISATAFGYSNHALWLLAATFFCTLLAVGGPFVVVRQWLEKAGVWIMLLASLWLTVHVLRQQAIGDLLAQPREGGAPFWVGVDLVIAMPISWLPLIADYSRFGRRPGEAFSGTVVGYLIANIWFYTLGVLLVLTGGLSDLANPAVSVAAAIAVLSGGLIALAAVLVDETDNTFADIYSAAVTAQNVFPQVPQRVFIVLVAAIGLVLAAFLNMAAYEIFLLIIGSIFVALFGVMAADYFVLARGTYQVEALYQPGGPYWYAGGVNWWGLVAWGAGIVTYHLLSPTLLSGFLPALQGLVPQALTAFGGSLPSFLISFLLYLFLTSLFRVRRAA
jgi:NCS1 family nucleobase:cation symporter-1